MHPSLIPRLDPPPTSLLVALRQSKASGIKTMAGAFKHLVMGGEAVLSVVHYILSVDDIYDRLDVWPGDCAVRFA